MNSPSDPDLSAGSPPLQAGSSPTDGLTRGQCWLILIVGFLGWGFAGVHLAITSLVMRVAAADLLPPGTPESEIGQWFGWLVCAFLFGAATGGYLFGLLGDRVGRARAMGASILCYAIFSGWTYVAPNAPALLVLRFLTCLGIGGMWPNGIALVSEAWPRVSRPIISGVMGTSANVGILLFAVVTMYWHVTPTEWRWTFLVGAVPVLLGLFSLWMVPESPRWLALQARGGGAENNAPPGMAAIFRPPILKTTALGIMLGTVPLFGGWGVSNWATAWASEAGDKPAPAPVDEGSQQIASAMDAPAGAGPLVSRPDGAGGDGGTSDPTLKSRAAIYRALPGSVTSLLGGAIAYLVGRRLSYFLLCTGALVCTQFLFRVGSPNDPAFLYWMAALGAFSGAFFGWLPLCLPELFPTRVRSTGAGVSFNFGRILTGFGVLASAWALKQAFQGRYADVGLLTGFVYAVGMVVILLTPDTSQRDLDE